jgi:hypothetical protein
LDRDRLVPDSLTIREPTLDDVFLQLTGHRAEMTTPVEESDSGPFGHGRKEGAA